LNRVAVDFRDITEPAWLDRAASFALKAIDAIGEKSWDLSILICGEEFMAYLNAEYRGKEGPTDVLSFCLGEWIEMENERRYMAGDVVLCLSVLESNASEFHVSKDEELKRLILHGVLHLSGMDHETNEPSEAMLLRQESLLEAFSEETIF
jgi:probable rRNA maturation factor